MNVKYGNKTFSILRRSTNVAEAPFISIPSVKNTYSFYRLNKTDSNDRIMLGSHHKIGLHIE